MSAARTPPLDRRAFLRRSVHACALAALAPGALRAEVGAEPLRLAVAVPSGDGPLRRGAVFGLEEVEQAAALLRRPLAGGTMDAAEAARLAGRGGGTLLVGAVRGREAEALAASAAAAGIPFLNAAEGSDALRARCLPGVFHVAPADAMVAAARALAGAEGGEILPWHHALDRFGASQLNDRYLVRFGEPMPPQAWAVWMGVKIAWEGAVRARATDAPTLAAHLLAPRTRFDGHKGAPLTFRADRQLRQPLYLAGGGGERPRQLPDLRGDGSPEEQLDALHPGEPRACPGAGATPARERPR